MCSMVLELYVTGNSSFIAKWKDCLISAVCVRPVACIQSVQDIRLVSSCGQIGCLEICSCSVCCLHADLNDTQLFYSEWFDAKYIISSVDYKLHPTYDYKKKTKNNPSGLFVMFDIRVKSTDQNDNSMSSGLHRHRRCLAELQNENEDKTRHNTSRYYVFSEIVQIKNKWHAGFVYYITLYTNVMWLQ